MIDKIKLIKDMMMNTSSNQPSVSWHDMTVSELAKLLASNQSGVQLIDVREPHERDICHIGGVLIPLNEIHTQLSQLNPKQLTVVYCRSGGRSAQACQWLSAAGFSDLYNLKGGILQWINEIDPSLTAY